jgi:hypothetical protein
MEVDYGVVELTLLAFNIKKKLKCVVWNCFLPFLKKYE